MKVNFNTGDHVRVFPEPNRVNVIYEIVSFSVFVEDKKVKVVATLRVIANFYLLDGGYIAAGQIREENVLKLRLAN